MVEIVRAQFPDIDVEDVVQETLIALAKVLPSYHYAPDEKGRFRNYLAGIILNKARCAQRREAKERGRMAALRAVSEKPLPAEEDETAWRWQLYEMAVHEFLANPLVTDWTKQIFVRLAVNGEPPDEVAKAFQTNRHRIDQAKSRALGTIRKLVESLREIVNG